MHKQDLALNNLRGLICHKNQATYITKYTTSPIGTQVVLISPINLFNTKYPILML